MKGDETYEIHIPTLRVRNDPTWHRANNDYEQHMHSGELDDEELKQIR